jgi:hypothetical protein
VKKKRLLLFSKSLFFFFFALRAYAGIWGNKNFIQTDTIVSEKNVPKFCRKKTVCGIKKM